AGFPIDAHSGNMYAIRIIHVLVVIPGNRRETRFAPFARRRCRPELSRQFTERDGGAILVSSDNATVNDIEFARVALQQSRRKLHGLSANLQRTEPRGFAGHNSHTRGMSPEPKSNTVCVAVQYADAPIVNTERVGANLGKHGFHSLP